MDGDNFENTPRVDANIIYTDKKDVFTDTYRRGLRKAGRFAFRKPYPFPV